MVSMTSIKGMDVRHKGIRTYVYKGYERTFVGDVGVRAEGM